MRSAKIPLPKICIFCGERRKLTREDFFPEWFRELYPRPAGFEQRRLNAQASWYEVSPTGDYVMKVGASHLARAGDLADQTLRVVCAPCNNGWMSRVQAQAKPFLSPLIKGDWSEPSPPARVAISAWATMFTMVTEFCDAQSAAIPAVERMVFSQDQRPLIGSFVWAGRAAGDLPYWFHHRSLHVAEATAELRGGANTQVTTITLGHLLLQVYTSTTDIVPFCPNARASAVGLTVLWPLRLKRKAMEPLRVHDAEAVRSLAYKHLSDDVRPGTFV